MLEMEQKQIIVLYIGQQRLVVMKLLNYCVVSVKRISFVLFHQQCEVFIVYVEFNYIASLRLCYLY